MADADRGLIDRFGRRVDYLRLSVTDRCDLRCSYCLPRGFHGFAGPAHWLSFEEIERVVSAFARLGVGRVRLTGGEPLVRARLPELAGRLGRLPGIRDLSLSTNGTRLAEHAGGLRQAGVSRLNVSLDSLTRERIRAITGRDALPRILAGLEAAKRLGFAPIKINMVVLKGVNDDEIDAMAAYCMEQGFILRLIEPMPMGISGRNTPFTNLQSIMARLKRKYGLVDGVISGGGPARYLKSADGRFSLGFITPISRHFCGACNRVRLAVDGALYLCLGQEDKVELAPLLRGRATDDELAAAIRGAIGNKPERHDFSQPARPIVRVMAQTGG